MSKIKLCGLTRIEDAESANQARPDWVGFVFDKGRHFLTDDGAAEIRRVLRQDIPAVGVFVNDDPEHIVALAESGVIQYVQLHGHEPEEYLRALRRRISCPFIRVISVRTTEDVLRWQDSAADYLLLDHGKGGTGKSFDWALIPPLRKPWIMAGGIGLSNLEQALAYQPYGIDISSGAETDGVKDRDKMIRLVQMVRTYDRRGEDA